MKKRGLKSPDKADAVIMAFIGGEGRARRQNIRSTIGSRTARYPRNVQQRVNRSKRIQRPRFLEGR